MAIKGENVRKAEKEVWVMGVAMNGKMKVREAET